MWAGQGMGLADRVARSFVAEELTKEWLMGIRRGWLQLMKPSVTDFEDVVKAIVQLDRFVDRLKDQVFFVKRGPKTGLLSGTKERKRAEVLFKQLSDAVYEAKSGANHWKDWLDGTALGFQWGEDRSDDARHMLKQYKTDFEGTTSGSVPIRGGGGRHRPQPLTETLDKILKLLRADAKILKDLPDRFDTAPAYKEFDLGGVKVIIDDETVSAREIDQYVKFLIKARQILNQKGFAKAWTGEVFIKCKGCGGTSQFDESRGVGGHYHIGPNTITVYVRPSKYVTELTIHELGHRWWFKNMTRANRLRFQDWFDEGLAPVSAYGKNNAAEAFAEAFAWFVLGRSMSSQQVETFKMVALGRRFSAMAERVAARFTETCCQPASRRWSEPR